MPLTVSRRCAPLVALLAGLAASLPALAQEGVGDPRIDDRGRDAGVYPPDPVFTYEHQRVVMDIPDMSQSKFSATTTLTIRPIAVPQTSIALRAGEGLTIAADGVTLDGQACTFTRNGEALKITFPTAVAVGQTVTLSIRYDATKPGGGGAGLTWSKDDPRTPEEDFMFHSQGQPESNHRWIPCHDFPNLRLTTEVIVTVPKDYEALSNGHLVEMKRLNDGRTTFHWLQDKLHSTYLVSLIVSKFDVVNVGGPKSARPGLWMPVYGPLGSGDTIREGFGATAEMVAVYEKLFDEPYPWDKYAQSIARDFAAGAMENTSATTFAPFAATSRGNMLDGIIAHELVHQWFGDLVGYKSWEHLWLGEGWATYGEALWAEHKNGRDGYDRAVLGNMRRERGSGRNSSPRDGGMVTNRYGDPQQRFMSTDNVYSKGGFILHMLRERLGNDAFWKGVALYLDRYKFKLAETDDFRRCLEETSGQSLERFFEQWCERPGNPTVEIDYAWDDSAKTLKVTLEQTQKIDADNPAYAITVPVEIETVKEGEWRTEYVNMDTRRVERTITLAQKPAAITIDSAMSVLMRTRVRQPLEALLHEAEHGRTYFARARAVDALSEIDDPRVVELLTRVSAAAERAGDEYLKTLAADSLHEVTTRFAGR